MIVIFAHRRCGNHFRETNYNQHTFAISGVSGGSLGATVFAGLAKQMAKYADYVECDFSRTLKSGPFETKVQAIFGADLLSPVLATALFPDLLQRVLPPFVFFECKPEIVISSRCSEIHTSST